jgi:hypothetical protein
MIISHKYKFIFVRTEKTGGTSLQCALGEICDPGDVVTGPFQRRAPDVPRVGNAQRKLRRRFPKYFGLHAHTTIGQVRSIVGDRIFNDYFKFAIERNPWDRQVSLYAQRKKQYQPGKEFNFHKDLDSLWFRCTEYVRLHNWDIYTINNQIAVDKVVRYENLDDEISEVLSLLGISDSLKMPKRRAGYRNDGGNYRSLYCDRTRNLVARWYHREIEAFGYEF